MNQYINYMRDLLYGGYVNVIGGRPGMGKTSFLISLLQENYFDGTKILFVSSQLNDDMFKKRLVSCVNKVEYHKVNIEKVEKELLGSINPNSDSDWNVELYLDCNSDIIGIEERLSEKEFDFVFIDDFQALKTIEKQNRHEEISSLVYSLKRLSLQYDASIIATANLNRSVETRGGDKRPLLHDLDSSGIIESVADSVSFLYRPEYYGITEDENGIPTVNVCELLFRKNNIEDLETIPFTFIGRYLRFEEARNNRFKETYSPVIQSDFDLPDDDAPF